MFGITNSYGFDMLILSTIYAFFVFFVYHSKEKVYSRELKAFGYLIDINFISSLFEVACAITIVHLGMNNIFTIIVNNIYVLILGFFNVALLSYFISISLSEEEIKKGFKIINIIIIIAYIVYAMGVLILPLELVNDYRGIFSTGPSVVCLVIEEIVTLACCTIFMFYGIFKNKVEIQKS